MNVGASLNIPQSITSGLSLWKWGGGLRGGGQGEGGRGRERCFGFVHFFSEVQNSLIVGGDHISPF